MLAYWLIVAHLVGDYLLQSDWMAQDKTKAVAPAAAHALVYTLPFAVITQAPAALAVICLSHFAIDRYRLARYVVWAKNLLAPTRFWYSWSSCAGTGYHKARPDWLTVWLLIIADNTLHLVINGLAVQYLG